VLVVAATDDELAVPIKVKMMPHIESRSLQGLEEEAHEPLSKTPTTHFEKLDKFVDISGFVGRFF
jgi:hypothetical protein